MVSKAIERTNAQQERIVVMLGARMRRTRCRAWTFPLISADKTNSGTSLPIEVSGGSSRMRAVQAEYVQMLEGKPTQQMVVLVTGGREPCGTSRADEAARQLVERYGLPASSVVPIGGLGSTLGNAGATLEYMTSRSMVGAESGTIYILTNNYHMLRAWIMFSVGMFRALRNQDVSLSAVDSARLKRILRNGIPESRKKWSELDIATTRSKAIGLLKPYFTTINIDIGTLVVEEILERSGETGRRYAGLIRSNRWVSETIKFEYQGIRDLLWPRKQRPKKLRRGSVRPPPVLSVGKQ